MASGITENDKVFAVRQPTWHGLEDLLKDFPTRQEAEALVHPFQVLREPLYRKVPAIHEDGSLSEEFILYEEEELNVRSDNGLALAAVPVTRVDVQPKEVWDLAELIQGEDKNVMFETAGTLFGGKHIWILIKLNEPIQIKGDPLGESLPYFVLQNGYVNGVALRGQASNIRVVCWNTSRLSDFRADAMGVNFSFAHTLNLRDRVDEIRGALARWREGIVEWQHEKELMADIAVTPQQVNWFVDQFIPMPDITLISDRVVENVETARLELITELYSGRNQGITDTALGLFEAASSWNEHVRRAQSPMTRFKRSMLEPDSILAQAKELAMAAADV